MHKKQATLASLVYEWDGNLVQAIEGSTTTNYIGNHYEWRVNQGTTAVKKYYYAAGQRIAVRLTDDGPINLLSWIVGDYAVRLAISELTLLTTSTSVTTYEGGTQESLLRYYAWGDVRYSEGTKPTDYTFTGQQKVKSIGLMFYNARWYDASLGRFIQADTIIPGGVQGLDRYAYVNNSPTNFTDTSGHNCEDLPQGSREQCIHTRRNEPKRVIEMWFLPPDPRCKKDDTCNRAYETVMAIIDFLGYVPTIYDLLYMIMNSEYYAYINNDGTASFYIGGKLVTNQTFREWMKEALARTLYEVCGKGCNPLVFTKSTDIYWFLATFEPFWKKEETPEQRATRLVNALNDKSKSKLMDEDIAQIVNHKIAYDNGWINSRFPEDRPRQWGNYTHAPTTGDWPNEAMGYIVVKEGYGGNYFWVLSAKQDRCINHPYDPACIK